MRLQSDAALAQSLSVDRFKTHPGRLLGWNGVFAEYGLQYEVRLADNSATAASVVRGPNAPHLQRVSSSSLPIVVRPRH